MTASILLACLAGVLVGISRQLNGRLGASIGMLGASFWNHLIGCAALTLIGLLAAGMLGADRASLLPPAAQAPWHAYLGGPLGVAFVAASSLAVLRIGALRAAALIIAGQMLAGLAIDYWRGMGAPPTTGAAGVALALAGVLIGKTRR